MTAGATIEQDKALIEKPLRSTAIEMTKNQITSWSDIYSCFQKCTGKTMSQAEFNLYLQRVPALVTMYRQVLALWMPDHFLNATNSGNAAKVSLLEFSQLETVRYTDPAERDQISDIIMNDRMALNNILFRDARAARALATNTDREAQQKAWSYMRKNETRARQYYFAILQKLVLLYPFLLHLPDPHPDRAAIQNAIALSLRPLYRTLQRLPKISLDELIYYNQPVSRFINLHPEMAPVIYRVRQNAGPLEFTLLGWGEDFISSGLAWPALFCLGTMVVEKPLPVLAPSACMALDLFITTRSLVKKWQQTQRDEDSFESGLIDYQDERIMLRKIFSDSFLNVMSLVPTAVKASLKAVRAAKALNTNSWKDAVAFSDSLEALKLPDPYVLAVRKKISGMVDYNFRHSMPVHAGLYSKAAVGFAAAGVGSKYADNGTLSTAQLQNGESGAVLITWGQIVQSQDKDHTTLPQLNYSNNDQ